MIMMTKATTIITTATMPMMRRYEAEHNNMSSIRTKRKRTSHSK